MHIFVLKNSLTRKGVIYFIIASTFNFANTFYAVHTGKRYLQKLLYEQH